MIRIDFLGGPLDGHDDEVDARWPATIHIHEAGSVGITRRYRYECICPALCELPHHHTYVYRGPS